MLYFLVITIFLAVLVWDTRRVEKKMHECCGACCCAENTFLCCGSRLASPKQRDYSGIEESAAEKA